MRHWLSDRHPGPASMAGYLSGGADKDRPMREFPASPITSLIDEKPRYNLGESMAADLTVADLLGPAELAGLAGVNLGYGTTAGDPALRALVAARHGIPASQVLTTAGAAAALFLTALLCADGEVLVRLPCFPPVLDTLRGVGARVVTVRSRFEDGYRIDPDAFARQLSPRTQLVMVASPQNPSGVPISDSEAEQMLTAMSRACPAALLLIDETFREATYGDAPPARSFAGTSPRVLTCGSLAKAYGVPGLRVGWLTVPDPGLHEQLRLAKFNASVCCGALDEYLAAAVLGQADQLLAARGALLAQARSTVERWIKEHTGRLRWLRPHAGAFCCLQLDPGTFGPSGADRFHAHLKRQRTVVAPGPWFGDSPLVFRIGLGYEPADRLEQGLGIISAALEATG
jgi:aspartate/methionine/tyrosine aminotransferase